VRAKSVIRDNAIPYQSGMAACKDETEAVILDFLIIVTRLPDARR
jgi:hypothetical protein